MHRKVPILLRERQKAVQTWAPVALQRTVPNVLRELESTEDALK